MLLTQDIPTKKPEQAQKPVPRQPDETGKANEIKRERHLKLMEELIQIKKDRTNQYQKIKPVIFNFSLVLAMLMVVAAFEWKSYGNDGLVDLGALEENIDEVLDIPITEQPPPPPPSKKIVQPKITVVEDVEELIEDIELDFDVEMTEETVVEKVEQGIDEDTEEEEVDEIFTVVESYPEPKGGMQDFLKYLYENIRYPKKALRARIDGKVFVQFVVGKDGALSDFEVLKGIGMGCDEEAVRVLKASPKWKPGKQRGKAVKVKRVLPIIFKYKERGR